MPWPCYLVKEAGFTPWEECPGGGRRQFCLFEQDGQLVRFEELRVGAMWFEDDELVVKMPDNSTWNIDRGRKANERGGVHTWPGWNRKGEPPNITVEPSVNDVGRYHGYLRDGYLTSDIEGRKFEGEPGV